MAEPIGFYIRKKEFGFLSNFHRVEQTIDGITYPTNEHYYQSMKAKDVRVRAWIASSVKAFHAMKAGRSLRDNEMIDNWDGHKLEVMQKGLMAKFSQNPDLARMLIETGDAELFEDSPTDMFWGGKLEGSQNWIGKLLMLIREELIKEEGTNNVA